LSEGSVIADPGGPFAAQELVPARFRASLARRTLFALPLASETRHWGVVVVEFGDGMGANEFLREQLSAALATVALHREIIDKTKLHERSVQERLATAERINALSVLAGGVAHDLNNALGPLLVLPELIKDELMRTQPTLVGEGSEIAVDLDFIKSAALRAAQTIGDLLTLGRQGRTAQAPLELNETIADCVSEIRLRFPTNAGEASRVVFVAGPEPLTIRGASQQLRRAISNLVQNAIEASPEGAPVTVTSSRLLLAEPWQGYETVDAGEYAAITVVDRGQGIREHELPRIFEPFFSGKRLQEQSGSGLGLAIVHGVVKEHKGFLDVRGMLGGGTRFTLFLPITDDAIPQSQKPALVVGGSARVLVVDDEVLQLRSAKRVLTQLGYDVTTLASGDQAIESFAEARARADDSSPAPFDLVVMDVHLNQRLDGLQVIEQLRRFWPEQKCLVVSGNAEASGVGSDSGELLWLAKPFEAAGLAHAVREALSLERRAASAVRST
jgi:two-component system cell cycle sensor histidine kinase/response regulator CckA